MEDNPGTSGEWFLCREAECSDTDSCDEVDISYESEYSDFVDNGSLCQGNSRQLFVQQENEQHERSLSVLKRKYVGSPKQKVDCELSPRIRAINISPEKRLPKRRLCFHADDSGIECSTQNEAGNVTEEGCCQVTLDVSAETVECPPLGRREDPHSDLAVEILKSCNRRATLCSKFQQTVGVGFAQLTRDFKNDKTCTGSWVAAVFDVFEDLFEASKMLLQPHCSYYSMSRYQRDRGSITLILFTFNVNKSRMTLINMLKHIYQVEESLILANPPKLRSPVTACFWFKRSFSSACTVFGETPGWLKKQTSVCHENREDSIFQLSDMVQWAYDNDYTTEAEVAYEYARLADQDNNAYAWLKSNGQAKFVKDCVTMVRMYKTAEMREKTMSAWVHYRCKKFGDNGDWKPICRFLKYQEVEVPMFIDALKLCFKKVPKKCCLVVHGPPDTGKSTFFLSLIRFLAGAVLSFVNYKSHFWLSPLSTCKVALIDDATGPCWDYMDKYMRNALDGSEVSLDLKHKMPLQIKCPPMFITTNCDLFENERWKYLRSRVNIFTFKHPFPMTDDGSPMFLLTEANWKSFFIRLWAALDLSDQEDEPDGETENSFRCTARRDS